MVRVAITGGIAEGKSTVLQILRENGLTTASADELAKQVFNEDKVQSEIASLLGRRDSVSSEELRGAIAGNPELRREVNRITHPLILKRIESVQAEILEVPLLFETCIHPLFPRVWVVTAGIEVQRERLMSRYWDREFVDKILYTQLPTRAKLPFADEIIRTNESLPDVRRFVLGCALHEFG